MNPQFSVVFALLAVLVLMGGGYALLHSGSPHTSLPPGADAATYQKLCTGTASLSCEYAKDKRWVYFQNSIVPGADAATFAVIDRFYAKDKNHVYYSAHGDTMPQIVPGDPATFKNLGGDGLYTLDQTAVYWDNTPIPNADPYTFVEIYAHGVPTVYGKDATTVYHAGSVTAADPNTFRIIQIDSTSANGGADGYAADGTAVYYDGSVVPGADPNTFVPPGATDTVTQTQTANTSVSAAASATTSATTTTTFATASSTPVSSQSNTTQASGFTGIFTGYTLSNTPSGDTSAYYDPSGTIKNPNGF